MRILLLTHSFNSLTQRLWSELSQAGHTLSVEFDINDAVTQEAVALFDPDLIVAPFLRRAIPEDVWRRHVCLVVHPGIVGDRGPSALDWAISNAETAWGVTVLQANAEMDAGDIWATESFPMRPAAKSSLYRREVTEAAVRAVHTAVARYRRGDYCPQPLDYTDPDVVGCQRPLMKQSDRSIDWATETTEAVLRKIRAADGQPGVLDELCGRALYLYDAWPEDRLRGRAGAILARRGGALCRATVDGAVWIGHVRLRPPPGERGFKLPATRALYEFLAEVPESDVAIDAPLHRSTYREIVYHERAGVGYLAFPFYNGAMSTERCQRLLRAYEYVRKRPVRVIVLSGGPDFWSNGMCLNSIEAAPSPADESWRNINAIDDLARAIITTDDRVTIAALNGNAGAGGVFLALAADQVVARRGVILNPHYKNMGNLYGSEYWTYLLPRRVSEERARELMQNRLPVSASAAQRSGLLDGVIDAQVDGFDDEVRALAEAAAGDPALPRRLASKREGLSRDESKMPLERYRETELERMRLNFYGFDPSYHVARYNFVFRVPHSRTPLHLAVHRRASVSIA